jgi:hypothetical protein
MRALRPHALAAVACAALAGAVIIGLTGATAKSRSGGPVHACVANAGGAVRFVKLGKSCASGEASLLIDQVGPRGKTGKTGKRGKAGATGLPGGTGVVGPTGPAGPANSEVVDGPAETLVASDNSGDATGEVAVSTASCSSATNPANVEAYGGGLNIVTHPQTQSNDVVEMQSAYPVEATGPTGATGITGVTGPLGAPVPQAQPATAWTGEAVVDLLKNGSTPDSATVQTYVECGP